MPLFHSLDEWETVIWKGPGLSLVMYDAPHLLALFTSRGICFACVESKEVDEDVLFIFFFSAGFGID